MACRYSTCDISLLVCMNAPADRRSVSPSIRSSNSSRPNSVVCASPAVTSATPSLTACTTPTTPSGSIRCRWSIAGTGPGAVTSIASSWPVLRPSRTTRWRRKPAPVRWSYACRPCSRAHRSNARRSSFETGDAMWQVFTAISRSQRPATWNPSAAPSAVCDHEYSNLLR